MWTGKYDSNTLRVDANIFKNIRIRVDGALIFCNLCTVKVRTKLAPLSARKLTLLCFRNSLSGNVSVAFRLVLSYFCSCYRRKIKTMFRLSDLTPDPLSFPVLY